MVGQRGGGGVGVVVQTPGPPLDPPLHNVFAYYASRLCYACLTPDSQNHSTPYSILQTPHLKTTPLGMSDTSQLSKLSIKILSG